MPFKTYLSFSLELVLIIIVHICDIYHISTSKGFSLIKYQIYVNCELKYNAKTNKNYILHTNEDNTKNCLKFIRPG